MAKCAELTGQKFGMLYVESKAESLKDNYINDAIKARNLGEEKYFELFLEKHNLN